MNWYTNLVKQARYFSVDPEEPDFGEVDIDPYDALDQADKVFNVTGIHPDRNKQIRQVVMPDEQDEVIGALADGWNRNDECMEYSFDLSVLKNFQGQGVGKQLIQNAINTYNKEKNAYEEMGEGTQMRIHAVNPAVVHILESEHGFNCDVAAHNEKTGEPSDWMCYA